MVSARVPSGINGLDPLIGGGFPRGSLILVCGNPGTGKTIFSSQFIYKGVVEYGENGVYVSFGEGRKNFYEYMKMFGFDFERLESKGQFAFLEMIGGREDLHPMSTLTILEKVYDLNAKRLVIDPVTALSQSFREITDVRTFMHVVLGKIVREAECTTLVTLERPFGKETMGMGLEEFVADNVILLKKELYEGRILRKAEIIKCRGTKIPYTVVTFTLDEEFHVFPPVELETIKLNAKYETIPHETDYFSTGIKDLDRIAGKMFQRGSFELIEVEKDVTIPTEYFITPMICNFLNQGYGVAVIPPQGISAKTLESLLKTHVDSQVLQQNSKIVDYRVAGEGLSVPPNVLPLRGEYIVEDMKRFWDATTELREKTGKPVLSIVGYDTLEYIYGTKEVLKILGEDIARIRNFEDLRINLVRPMIQAAEQLGAIAHMHLKICQINGAVFIYGVKPPTPLANIYVKTENNMRKIKLKHVV